MISIESLTFIVVLIAAILAAIMTFKHLFLNQKLQCYDSWLFPVFLAMLLQMYENMFKLN